MWKQGRKISYTNAKKATTETDLKKGEQKWAKKEGKKINKNPTKKATKSL